MITYSVMGNRLLATCSITNKQSNRLHLCYNRKCLVEAHVVLLCEAPVHSAVCITPRSSWLHWRAL